MSGPARWAGQPAHTKSCATPAATWHHVPAARAQVSDRPWALPPCVRMLPMRVNHGQSSPGRSHRPNRRSSHATSATAAAVAAIAQKAMLASSTDVPSATAPSSRKAGRWRRSTRRPTAHRGDRRRDTHRARRPQSKAMASTSTSYRRSLESIGGRTSAAGAKATGYSPSTSMPRANSHALQRSKSGFARSTRLQNSGV